MHLESLRHVEELDAVVCPGLFFQGEFKALEQRVVKLAVEVEVRHEPFQHKGDEDASAMRKKEREKVKKKEKKKERK